MTPGNEITFDMKIKNPPQKIPKTKQNQKPKMINLILTRSPEIFVLDVVSRGWQPQSFEGWRKMVVKETVDHLGGIRQRTKSNSDPAQAEQKSCIFLLRDPFMCLCQILQEALWSLELIPQSEEHLPEDANSHGRGESEQKYWWETYMVASFDCGLCSGQVMVICHILSLKDPGTFKQIELRRVFSLLEHTSSTIILYIFHRSHNPSFTLQLQCPCSCCCCCWCCGGCYCYIVVSSVL